MKKRKHRKRQPSNARTPRAYTHSCTCGAVWQSLDPTPRQCPTPTCEGGKRRPGRVDA